MTVWLTRPDLGAPRRTARYDANRPLPRGSNPSPSVPSGRKQKAAPVRVSCQMGPKPRSPSAPPSAGRKPPPTLGNRRIWRAGSERFPARSGPGWNASCAATAARTTGRRPACRGPSRSWRSTASGPRRCRTCGHASCAGREARSGLRPRVSPGPNRATPTAHLSPTRPTRYRPTWAISGVHPPSTRPGIWAS
jgi:hypothetical protein